MTFLDRLLRWTSASPPSFGDLLQLIYDHRYTGTLTLHFAGGKPHLIELPQQPLRVPLSQPSPEGGRQGVDTVEAGRAL